MATRALASLAPAPRARARTSARGRAARASRRPLTHASAGAAPDPESSPASETPPAASFSVVVFGANGKTGKRCVAQAAAAGARVVACSRAGDFATSGLTNASLVETRAGAVETTPRGVREGGIAEGGRTFAFSSLRAILRA